MVQSEGQVLVRGQSVLCKFGGVLGCNSCRPRYFSLVLSIWINCRALGLVLRYFWIYWQQ